MSNQKQGLRAPTPSQEVKKRPERKRYLERLEEAMVAAAGIPAAWSVAAAASRAKAPPNALRRQVFTTQADPVAYVTEQLKTFLRAKLMDAK